MVVWRRGGPVFVLGLKIGGLGDPSVIGLSWHCRRSLSAGETGYQLVIQHKYRAHQILDEFCSTYDTTLP